MSEIECWNAQECARKQRLATGSHGWLATASRQKMHTCQACQKLKRHASWSTTGQNKTTGRSVISRLDLATQLSREIIERLVVLFCPVVLQLAWRFNFWHAWHVCSFWRLVAARSSRESLFFLHTIEHFFTLSHSLPLQESHLNTGLLITEIQANLARNKANKMVD